MRLQLTFTLSLCAIALYAVEPDTSIDAEHNVLDAVEVVATAPGSTVQRLESGALRLRMDALANLPLILGTADPIHYAHMLPGVQTNNEYESGTHIQGCENSHNFLSLDGVPVYNASHFLGFFSTFNPSHYQNFTLQKSPTIGEAPNRIGGLLDMGIASAPCDSLCGDFNLGLISSRASINIAASQNTAIRISGRISYINLLYNHWLTTDNSTIRYSFYDINGTVTHRINSANNIIVNFYTGHDRAHLDQGSARYLSDVADSWGNFVGAIKWGHRGEQADFTQTVYITSSHNKFTIDMPDLQFKLPSAITETGYCGTARINRWDVGAKLSYYSIRPQSPALTSDITTYAEPNRTTHNPEATVHCAYTLPIGWWQFLTTGVRLSIFGGKNRTFYAADPSISWQYARQGFSLRATYDIRRQYLFQAGFMGMGLPTEYWFAADSNYPAQYGHNASVSAAVKLLNRQFELSGEIYYKRLYNQVEYHGSVLDFTNQNYDPLDHLIRGNGHNYGINVMLTKCSGKLSGWVSYCYSRAIRRFASLSPNRTYPANHDRPHEVNVVATYTINRHWSAGATYIYASGYPFTAPKAFYMLNGSIATEFSEHNANRVKPYSKLDVSVNYKWHGEKLKEQGVNLSIYNVLCRRNALYYRLKTYATGEFCYKPVTFVLPFLPSISYYANF